MYLCFAPMDGITNCATRLVTSEIFSKYGNKEDTLTLRTEFMNVDGFLINPNQVIKHILTTHLQKPILQIYGGKEETLLKATEKIQNEYADLFSGIELNTGCPSNTVMKVGGGSDMLKDKEKTLDIIKKLSKIEGPLPFSLKTRAGINDADKPEQLKFLIKASEFCNKISIHGRTLKQLYVGEADWNFISEVKDQIKKNGNANCMIIGNGGISSYQEAKEKSKEYNVDGVMIGQAAIGNPWIFTQYEPTKQEKCETVLRHLDYSIACDEWFDKKIANNSNNITIKELEIPIDWIGDCCKSFDTLNNFQPHTIIEFRKFLFQYVKGIPGSKEWKQKMLDCKNYNEIKQEIINLFNK